MYLSVSNFPALNIGELNKLEAGYHSECLYKLGPKSVI